MVETRSKSSTTASDGARPTKRTKRTTTDTMLMKATTKKLIDDLADVNICVDKVASDVKVSNFNIAEVIHSNRKLMAMNQDLTTQVLRLTSRVDRSEAILTKMQIFVDEIQERMFYDSVVSLSGV